MAVTDSVFPSLAPEERVLRPLGVELRAGQCRSEEEILALRLIAAAVGWPMTNEEILRAFRVS